MLLPKMAGSLTMLITLPEKNINSSKTNKHMGLKTYNSLGFILINILAFLQLTLTTATSLTIGK